jgi:hypothetical protein
MSVAKELTAQVAMSSFKDNEFRLSHWRGLECFTLSFIDQKLVKGHENQLVRNYN